MTSMAKPASSAILERDWRFLLVRRANPPSAGMYAFPGGRGEPGESPADTALRELLEETGISGRDPRLFATYDIKTVRSGSEIESHFFLCVYQVEADLTAEALAAGDAAALGWFTPEEIEALPAPESVHDCVRRLRLREHCE